MLDQVAWLAPHRIIEVRYIGDIDLVDVARGADDLIMMIEQDGHPPYVHCILDASQRAEISKELFNLKTMRDLAEKLMGHELIGWVIVIDPNPNPVMNFIGSAISQLAKLRFRVYPTQAAALNFLQDIDKTLSEIEVVLSPSPQVEDIPSDPN